MVNKCDKCKYNSICTSRRLNNGYCNYEPSDDTLSRKYRPAIEYCYAVTCEDINSNGTDIKLSGSCYHEFSRAIKFVEGRSDNPKRMYEDNPFIWKGDKYIYKIHSLTFDN